MAKITWARRVVTLWEISYNNIKSKLKYEETYKGNDMLNGVGHLRRPLQYLYPDGVLHVFMDSQGYFRYMEECDAIEDELAWNKDSIRK